MAQEPNFIETISDEEIERRNKELTHISLFTGIGGFDLGFSKAGFKTRVMVEYNKDCCKTLRANWFWEELRNRKDHKGRNVWRTKKKMKRSITWYHEPEPVILEKDITKLTTKEILEAGNLQVGETTIISGGPPCQGFSTSGKRMINDPRNKLFKEFVRVVAEALPKKFIFENVPGLVSIAKGEIMKQICEEFANAGYNITWKLLNAADYGVPQHRIRVIMIGERVDFMKVTESGRIQIYMGAHPGRIHHPENFRKKHKLPEIIMPADPTA